MNIQKSHLGFGNRLVDVTVRTHGGNPLDHFLADSSALQFYERKIGGGKTDLIVKCGDKRVGFKYNTSLNTIASEISNNRDSEGHEIKKLMKLDLVG